MGLPLRQGSKWLNHGGSRILFSAGGRTMGFCSRRVVFGSRLFCRPPRPTPVHRAVRIIIPGAKVVYPKTLFNWFLPSAYTTPAPYTYGDARRNSLVGPGRTNFDTSLFKDFPIHEQIVLQFRIEAFNIFNHPQFGYPNQTVGNSQVGQITSIVGNARNLQGSLRLQF